MSSHTKYVFVGFHNVRKWSNVNADRMPAETSDIIVVICEEFEGLLEVVAGKKDRSLGGLIAGRLFWSKCVYYHHWIPSIGYRFEFFGRR